MYQNLRLKSSQVREKKQKQLKLRMMRTTVLRIIYLTEE